MKKNIILKEIVGNFKGDYDGRSNSLMIGSNDEAYPTNDTVEGAFSIRCTERDLKDLEALVSSFRIELYGPKELPKQS